MQKLYEIFGKVKTAIIKQKDSFLLLELAAIMLVVILAVNYVFNYSATKFSSEKTVNNMEYIYTNSSKEEFKDNVNVANSINPISREKVASYLHIRMDISANEKERTLIIKADHSPMKITVNGEEVYNNHYTSNEYVGNTYNAVLIPASVIDTKVEVSMYLPFSADIDVTMSNKVNNLGFRIGGGLIFGGILFVIALAILVFAVVLRFAKGNNSKLFRVFPITLVFSLTVISSALSSNTYLLNLSNFYNITLALENLSILYFAFATMKILKINEKKITFFLCVDVILVILSCVPNWVWLLKILIIATALFETITIAILIKVNNGLLNRRIQYAKLAYIMLIFLAMYNIVGSIMFNMNPNREYFAYTKMIGGFIFVGFILFVYIVKTFSYKNSEEALEKIKMYDVCVQSVTELMKSVLGCTSKITTCEIFANGIDDLCCNVLNTSFENGTSYIITENKDSTYKEIYNKSCGVVNNNAILKRCIATEKFCLFNETYFDMVFTTNDTVDCIFHFENIKNGLDSFFISIINTLYSCMKIALCRFNGNEDAMDSEIDSFVELAQNTEVSSGNNPEHLETVECYTRVLLREMNYPDIICDEVAMAAMLHDIGKIIIPFEITTKQGLLSEDERKIINRHTDYGDLILSAFDSEFMKVAALIANEHHEHYDGTGLHKIAGEDINEFARVVSVADVLDALTSKRSYKNAWSLDAAVEYIDSNSGTKFDPKVVEALHNCLDDIKSIIAEKKV